MTAKYALIHGTGLIGASVGLGLVANGWSVAGWDPDATALAEALGLGAIQRELTSPDGGMDEADLVFLCGPLTASLAELESMKTDALVTDIASVKAPVVKAGGHLRNFVAGHPMAGSTASGANFASGHLFMGASWVLCNDTAQPDAVDRMSAVVSSLGANPIVMSAEDHDRYVAIVSHLPRVLASALIEMLAQAPEARRLTAGSFRDLTRVAGSGAEWWTDVLLANENAVGEAVSDLVEILNNWKAELANGHDHPIRERLAAAREARSHLGAPIAEIRVVLFDRPGEIARVGTALSESKVDLRDIQLRHAEYGGGGILTLSVNVSETDLLREALAANGFELER